MPSLTKAFFLISGSSLSLVEPHPKQSSSDVDIDNKSDNEARRCFKSKYGDASSNRRGNHHEKDRLRVTKGGRPK